MKIYQHIIFSIIFLLILYPFFSYYSFIPFIASLLIDIDHYFYYIKTKKSLNIKSCYTFFGKFEKYEGPIIFFLAIFHTYEFLIIMIILSFFNEILALITVGLIFHLILDYIETKMREKPAKKSKTLYHYLKLGEDKKVK